MGQDLVIVYAVFVGAALSPGWVTIMRRRDEAIKRFEECHHRPDVPVRAQGHWTHFCLDCGAQQPCTQMGDPVGTWRR